jgi:hypothetical protein
MDIFDCQKAVQSILQQEGLKLCANTYSVTFRVLSDYYKAKLKETPRPAKSKQKELF